MSGWINAAGEIEGSTSTLTSPDNPATPQAETRFKGGWMSGSSGEKTPDITAGKHTLRPNDDTSDGLLATARTQAGSVIMGRSPRGTDVILIEGMPVSLNVAATLGYVVRNPDGSFSDKETPAALKDPAEAAKAQASVEKPADEPKGEPEDISFGEAAEATLEELINTQMPGDLIKTMDSVLLRGDIDQNTINRMDSTAGVEPEQMAEQVMTVWQGAYDAASDFMADLGIENGDAFQALINSDTRRQADMMEAARNYFMHNKTEGLATMAETYLPSMDRYEGARVKEMLTEAGYEFADKPGGGVDIIVSGQRISWEVAVKQKIITFSRG